MTYTFPTDPENEMRDRIRLTLGDTDINEPILTDEYIEALIAINTSEQKVAYLCAVAAAGKYARDVATAIGSLKEEAQVKWEHYMGLSRVLYNIWQGFAPDATGSGGNIFNMGNALVGWRSAQSSYPDPFFKRNLP